MTFVKTKNNYYSAIPGLLNQFYANNKACEKYNSQTNYGSKRPLVNIVDRQADYKIELAAPGLQKSDFNVKIENNLLTVSVQKEKENDEQTYTRKEFTFSNFEREFILPENKVEIDKVNAVYEAGILTVTLPKKEEAKLKPAISVEIS